MNRLRLVLDTNVFLVSLAPQYKYHWIYECIIQDKFDLCLSTEILLEYEEIIQQRYGLTTTDAKLSYLLLLPNIYTISPSYRWNLIENDEDDNKFVDSFVAANADYIIGNDKHFKGLDRIGFPPIRVLTYEEFEETYKKQLVG
ncbi:putative toxin-antitoxin system toxin component, PIN family [Spirosoma lituiforme]